MSLLLYLRFFSVFLKRSSRFALLALLNKHRVILEVPKQTSKQKCISDAVTLLLA